MALKTFPLLTFPAEALRWRLAFANVSGGNTMLSPGQVGETTGGGFWVAEHQGIDLGDEAAIRQWRANVLSVGAGVDPVIVEMLDWPLAPTVGGVPHGDGAPFSDSSEYATGAIVAEMAADAALRASELQITIDPGTAASLYGGEPLTLVHATLGPRLYMVEEVLDHVDNTWTVRTHPPLRDAVVATQEVDFNRPRCVMRAIDVESGAWPLITAGWRAKVTGIVFVEAFDDLGDI